MSNSNKMMTSVWWDMSSCPLPRDYDLRRVGPSIESALRSVDHADHKITSFFAFGNMKELSDSDIKEMDSLGIAMRHSHFALRDIMYGMHSWKRNNPPPANVMLISVDPRVVTVTPYLPLVPLEPKNHQPEYNVIRGFPSLITPKELLWSNLLETTILEQGGETTSQETSRSKPLCSVCGLDFVPLSDFLNHLNQSHTLQEKALHTPIPESFKQDYNLPDKPPRPQYHFDPSPSRSLMIPDEVCTFKAKQPNNNKTAVWWDMNTCQLPQGSDPRFVRPTIESALKSKIGSGPVAIFACGDMNYFEEDFIKDIASSGISIRHSLGISHILGDINSWKRSNPPPGNVMLISMDPDAEDRSPLLPLPLNACDEHHYNIIQGYVAKVMFHEDFLWQTMIDNMVKEPSTNFTGETSWLCTVCNVMNVSFTEFSAHLWDNEHSFMENWWFTMNQMKDEDEKKKDEKKKIKNKKKKKNKKNKNKIKG